MGISKPLLIIDTVYKSLITDTITHSLGEDVVRWALVTKVLITVGVATGGLLVSPRRLHREGRGTGSGFGSGSGSGSAPLSTAASGSASSASLPSLRPPAGGQAC